MDELVTTIDYFNFINRIFKLIEYSDTKQMVMLSILSNTISLKEMIMLYYNIIESNVKTVIPFNFYKKVLSTLPLFKHKNGHIYKCDHCNFFIMFNTFTYNKYNHVKPPLIYGFYDQTLLNNYITYYTQNFDNTNNIRLKYPMIQDCDTYERTLVHEYHEKYAHTKCQSIEMARYVGFNQSYKPNALLNLEIQPQTKNPITQYSNLISYLFPNIHNSQYVPSILDVNEIQRCSQIYLSKTNYTINQIKNPVVIFAVFSLLITNKLMDTQILQNRLTQKRNRYDFLTLREISNIFAINYHSILNHLPSIIEHALTIPELFI